MAAFVSEDFDNVQVSALGGGCRGRAEYRGRLVGFLERFNGLTYEPEEHVVMDDRVAIAYRMRAIENGNPINLQGVMMITVAEGLICRRVDYWDSLTYLHQTDHAGESSP